jgi:hypothetical protein
MRSRELVDMTKRVHEAAIVHTDTAIYQHTCEQHAKDILEGVYTFEDFLRNAPEFYRYAFDGCAMEGM